MTVTLEKALNRLKLPRAILIIIIFLKNTCITQILDLKKVMED